MANFKQIKKTIKDKTRLGEPPPVSQAGDTLAAPEIAPISRKAREATGRTEQFNTRVTPEFHRKLRMAAARDDLKMVEVLEIALELYESQKASRL